MNRALCDVPTHPLYVEIEVAQIINRLWDAEKQLGQKFRRRKMGRLRTNRSVVKAYEWTLEGGLSVKIFVCMLIPT